MTARHAICLNGEWDFMPLYGEPLRRDLPDRLVYEERKVRVPSSWRSSFVNGQGKLWGEIPKHGYAPMDLNGYPKEWQAADAGVLHRSFRVPEEMAGQRIVLRLDGIMEKAAIYLDRERFAVWEDGYLPLRLDVTDRVTPGGEHELHVVCGSFDTVTIASGQQKSTGLTGSWFSYVCRGIWQDAWLESYPNVALADVVVRTSYRQGTLEVDAAVESTDKAGGYDPERHLLTATLRVRERGSGPAGEPVLRSEAEVLPSGSAPSLCENETAGGIRTYRAAFRLDWQEAKLWSPDSPFLYEAELELRLNGRKVDVLTETFGFREIWTEGPQFVLNGVPINLRGDSWHFQGAIQMTEAYVRNWYRMCKEVGINSIRLHAEPYPSLYLDIADEEGMLIVDETAIYGSAKKMQADHPDYLANCEAHIRRLLRRDKNRPSVILWSLQNEMRWVDGRDGFKRFMPGWMAMMKEIDPTRPIIAEGDNRLLPKELTEVESRHYNIDGTIEQWDRAVPLVFGEHGGWWYICPQNASPYSGLSAYRGTDESTLGLAEKERLFVEYARRRGVSGISTFNFAHYFMRAMPDEDVVLSKGEPATAGVSFDRIPAYSLTLNNGLLPEEYPACRPNPAFAVMAAAFKAATIIPSEYNRSFYDDEPIRRRFDVYNDTLRARDVAVEARIVQEGRVVFKETFRFRQEPAERRTLELIWTPDKAGSRRAEAALAAVLKHDGETVHELNVDYSIYSASLKSEPVRLAGPVAYAGGDSDYEIVRALVPACERIGESDIANLGGGSVLIVGSGRSDPDGSLECRLQRFVASGGRLLLLEQRQLSLGKLALSRRGFMRAHAGSYAHPVLEGLGDDDLMFWHEDSGEEGPDPIIGAAFFKPVTGDYTMLLECGTGDFGDGGDLWTPLLEYRSGPGMFLANQLDVMSNADRVPQAMLLLRNMLAYVGSAATNTSSSTSASAPTAKTAVYAEPGGESERFLARLTLAYDAISRLTDEALAGRELLIAEASLLEEPGVAETARRFAEAGGYVVVLPADSRREASLGRLLDRPVKAVPHESYHLEAVYAFEEMLGISPVDLFGYDKVFLSPRDTTNRILVRHRLEVENAEALCVSVEGTAWEDYFIGGFTAEYSRLALVELNRRQAREPGAFLLRAAIGQGAAICSQLLPNPDDEKSVRLYTRLLGNLGASFADGVLEGVKGDAESAVEAIMALPCPPHVPLEEMRAYYIDPEFSLNNLGEGLYGWMLKRERHPDDGLFRIPAPNGRPWLFSCFVHAPEPGRTGKLRVAGNYPYELYLNGSLIPDPAGGIVLLGGINRLVVVVHAGEEPLTLGLIFHNDDGTYMNDLEYRLTIAEVEPK
ncbi:glycoside hydrolase family 2 protein [Cohnella thailandensis]|uniref:Glycoside hydrolase family 2 n=1 Tax=Cohnella thailandensis TaxID=557557 RepID=A0A841SKT7_9BACL|nr:glycoside hydrolase family 2 TIM barrel-domain containing protein [Cohnella thailandensis]MBB6633123.1 glycoside hydrolase family 2 [Cohnella thailandensis]MBP1975182.1 hypothetical protein [Cohnella thailandensis]